MFERSQRHHHLRPGSVNNRHVRRRLVMISPVAVWSLTILTGCHLSRVPSPAPSMAAVAASLGTLVGAHLLTALRAKITRFVPEVNKIHRLRDFWLQSPIRGMLGMGPTAYHR